MKNDTKISKFGMPYKNKNAKFHQKQKFNKFRGLKLEVKKISSFDFFDFFSKK